MFTQLCRRCLVRTHNATGLLEPLESRILYAVNHAPTLKTIATLGTAVDTLPFTISYNTLLTASNAADADGDPISFTIAAVGASGTLVLNGNPAAPNATVSSGDTLTWTPAAIDTGKVAAFTVTASDGVASSTPPIAVKIKTVLLPTVSIAAPKATVKEGGAGASGAATFTVSRANGDKTQPLTVNFTIAGTAVDGTNYDTASTLTTTVIIPANKSSVTIPIPTVDDGVATGNLTLQLTLSADANYVTSSKFTATVTIKDAAPMVTVTASRPTSSEAGNGTGQFTITRTGDTTQSLVVSFTLAGTATRGPDYYLSGSNGFSVTILAGAKSASFAVVAQNNHVDDVPNLNVILTLDADPTYQVSQFKPSATVTILEI